MNVYCVNGFITLKFSNAAHAQCEHLWLLIRKLETIKINALFTGLFTTLLYIQNNLKIKYNITQIFFARLSCLSTRTSTDHGHDLLNACSDFVIIRESKVDAI